MTMADDDTIYVSGDNSPLEIAVRIRRQLSNGADAATVEAVGKNAIGTAICAIGEAEREFDLGLAEQLERETHTFDDNTVRDKISLTVQEA